MTRSTTTTIARRFLRLTAAVLAGVLLYTATPADAINPEQRTAEGVMWYLGRADTFGSIDHFWSLTFGQSYRRPTIYWYNRWNGDDYQTACGHTSTHRNNGFYCAAPHGIFLDRRYMQALIDRFGDYAMGGFLAHEFGHVIQWNLNYRWAGHRSEYHADCLAGVYTRWGYHVGRLAGSDYWEFHNWLVSTPQSDSHGSPQLRAAWYRYGYNTYSLAACNLAFR